MTQTTAASALPNQFGDAPAHYGHPVRHGLADPTFRRVVQVIAFPALVASGLLLRRGPAVRRWLRTRRAI